MLLSNSYSKLGSLMIEKILVPLKNGLAPWELDTWRNMRKVSSEAASISCIYFQQKKKISKNQEIRNWITVLQYHKNPPKQTNKKAPQNSKSLLGHVHTDINSTTVRQAHKIKKKMF